MEVWIIHIIESEGTVCESHSQNFTVYTYCFFVKKKKKLWTFAQDRYRRSLNYFVWWRFTSFFTSSNTSCMYTTFVFEMTNISSKRQLVTINETLSIWSYIIFTRDTYLLYLSVTDTRTIAMSDVSERRGKERKSEIAVRK